MKKICFVITDTGGGHRAPANAPKKRLESIDVNCQIIMVNIYNDILIEYDLCYRWFGFNSENIYNKLILARGLAWLCKPLNLFFKLISKIYYRRAKKLLQQYWVKTQPDMVVSLAPYMSKVLPDSLTSIFPTVPFVVVLTDPEEWTKNFWFSPSYAHYTHYICPSQRAVEQALHYGSQNTHIHLTSGIILRPDFYFPTQLEKSKARQRLGLDPHLQTGIIMFGGYGSNEMHKILNKLARSSHAFQLIFICGNNIKLVTKLKSISTKFRKCVLGEVEDIAFYMRLADFFIGKPGANSVNEALQMRLPLIIKDHKYVMPQEQAVSAFVNEHQFGICLKSFAQIESAIERLLANYNSYKKKLMSYQNNGVFEASEILVNLLGSSD